MNAASSRRCSPRTLVGCVIAVIALVSPTASAHVSFEDLEVGATFTAGTSVELRWVDTISHQTTAYHLEFLPTADAPSVPIANDIPATEHSWTWEVPWEPCNDCSIRVIQDNVGSNYSSTFPIVIVNDQVPPEGSGGALPDDREASGMHHPPEPQSTSSTAPEPSATGSAAPSSSMQSWQSPGDPQVQDCSIGEGPASQAPVGLAWLFLLAVAGVIRRRLGRQGMAARPSGGEGRCGQRRAY